MATGYYSLGYYFGVRILFQGLAGCFRFVHTFGGFVCCCSDWFVRVKYSFVELSKIV